jgi:hypothetical protein
MYHVLLYKCPKCNRPIPMIQTGTEKPTHVPDVDIECFEKLACRWKGNTKGMSPVRSLATDWPSD